MCVNAIPLVAFYDIHGGKREVLFFYIVPDTTRDINIYLFLFSASEGTLSRWSRLHLQSLAPIAVSRRVDVRQAAGRKNNCRIFITT
jgi:hypothetical protein